ncbi:GDSL-type esterase/lipase family protein [Nonomuraea sp. NPDC050663]|uniref:GDSL-type esterase/lipase family protein n=1 Tax=Nonomuraea sp. NPDC050663 TaxID=3364370 RepID=UPI0037B2538C
MLVDVGKLMIVGDSASHGSGTWRSRLGQHLETGGVTVDFVGDPSVAGTEAIHQKVAEHQPDYLLVQPGIDDLLWDGDRPEQAEVDLRRFIANARLGNPRVRVLIGRVLPTRREVEDRAFAERVAEFNVRLERAVNESRTKDSPVYTVPTDLDFVAGEHTRDGTRPNGHGEVRIAAAFADALAQRFSIGTPYPRPYPEVVLVPKQPTPPRAESRTVPDAEPAATIGAVVWPAVVLAALALAGVAGLLIRRRRAAR